MKVGDLVLITAIGESNMDDLWVSEGDKAIILKVYKEDGGVDWLKGEVLYKIAMLKDGYIIEHLLDKEIIKL